MPKEANKRAMKRARMAQRRLIPALQVRDLVPIVVTLTQVNVEGEHLADAFARLLRAWTLLRARSWFKRTVSGGLAGYEVTRGGAAKTQERVELDGIPGPTWPALGRWWHVHAHVLLLVSRTELESACREFPQRWSEVTQQAAREAGLTVGGAEPAALLAPVRGYRARFGDLAERLEAFPFSPGLMPVCPVDYGSDAAASAAPMTAAKIPPSRDWTEAQWHAVLQGLHQATKYPLKTWQLHPAAVAEAVSVLAERNLSVFFGVLRGEKTRLSLEAECDRLNAEAEAAGLVAPFRLAAPADEYERRDLGKWLTVPTRGPSTEAFVARFQRLTARRKPADEAGCPDTPTRLPGLWTADAPPNPADLPPGSSTSLVIELANTSNLDEQLWQWGQLREAGRHLVIDDAVEFPLLPTAGSGLDALKRLGAVYERRGRPILVVPVKRGRLALLEAHQIRDDNHRTRRRRLRELDQLLEAGTVRLFREFADAVLSAGGRGCAGERLG